jgi:hypothetical protein
MPRKKCSNFTGSKQKRRNKTMREIHFKARLGNIEEIARVLEFPGVCPKVPEIVEQISPENPSVMPSDSSPMESGSGSSAEPSQPETSNVQTGELF